MNAGDTNFIFSCYQSLTRLLRLLVSLTALADEIRIPARPCNICFIVLLPWLLTTYSFIQFAKPCLEDRSGRNISIVNIIYIDFSLSLQDGTYQLLTMSSLRSTLWR